MLSAVQEEGLTQQDRTALKSALEPLQKILQEHRGGRDAYAQQVCCAIICVCHHERCCVIMHDFSGEVVCAIVCVYAREAGTGQTPLCPSRRWQYLSSMQAG